MLHLFDGDSLTVNLLIKAHECAIYYCLYAQFLCLALSITVSSFTGDSESPCCSSWRLYITACACCYCLYNSVSSVTISPNVLNHNHRILTGSFFDGLTKLTEKKKNFWCFWLASTRHCFRILLFHYWSNNIALTWVFLSYFHNALLLFDDWCQYSFTC